MSKGDVVQAPNGDRVVLDDVGQRILTDHPAARIWDVTLHPGQSQPWHLHHNPYLVLNIAAAPCRMDWLDGSEPRHLNEYVGGAVLRPTSPVHMLTNVGDTLYRNRLVELTGLGERRPGGVPVDISPGDRTVAGVRPDLPEPGDGRRWVMHNEHVDVWEIELPAGTGATLELAERPHVLVAFDASDDPAGGTAVHLGGPLPLVNDATTPRRHYVVALPAPTR